MTLGFCQPSAPQFVVPAPALGAMASSVSWRFLVVGVPFKQLLWSGGPAASSLVAPAISWLLQPSPHPSNHPAHLPQVSCLSCSSSPGTQSEEEVWTGVCLTR